MCENESILKRRRVNNLCCSYGLKAKEAGTVQESEKLQPDEKAQKLAEFEDHIVRAIDQFEASLSKTFNDKDEFLNYLRNL